MYMQQHIYIYIYIYINLYIHKYRGTPSPSSSPPPYPPTLSHLSRSLRCGRFLKKWGSWVRGDTLARFDVGGLDDAAESCSLSYSCASHVLFGRSPVMYVCLYICKHEWWLCISSSSRARVHDMRCSRNLLLYMYFYTYLNMNDVYVYRLLGRTWAHGMCCSGNLLLYMYVYTYVHTNDVYV